MVISSDGRTIHNFHLRNGVVGNKFNEDSTENAIGTDVNNMKKILTIRHWQLFFILLGYWCVLVIILNTTEAQTTDVLDQTLFTLIPITVYPLFLGYSLRKYVAPAGQVTGTDIRRFRFFGMLWVVTCAAFNAINDDRTIIQPILGLLSFYAFFQFAKLPARIIKYGELKREPTFWEYIADVFQMFCWPLCVWWIQPRVNELFEKQMKRSKVG